MNAGTQPVPTRFGAETTFEVPIPTAPLRGAAEQELERLKGRLLHQMLCEHADASLGDKLRQAAAEAATLAWMTPYPLLVLPVLVEEKAREAQRRATQQRSVLRRSRALLVVSG